MNRAITVWKDGTYKEWNSRDAEIARDDPEWLTEIKLTNLKLLSEKEVGMIVDEHLDRIIDTYCFNKGYTWRHEKNQLKEAICSHFSKPVIKYPEKKVFYGDKRDTELTSEYDQGYAKGWNDYHDRVRLLNGEGGV